MPDAQWEPSPEDLRRDGAERLAILDGLVLAIERGSEVLDTVVKCSGRDAALPELMSRFGWSATQATAVLDLQIFRFGAREKSLIVDERDELRRRLEGL